MSLDYPDFQPRYEQSIRELEQLGRVAEADEMRRLGYQVFLSDPGSARPNGVYFCGLKPFGAADASYPAGVRLNAGYSEYRDGPSRWPFYPRARNIIYRTLEHVFGPDTPFEAALCTNWFFYRAADTQQLKRFGPERIDCSAFHRAFLDRLQPRIILCAGNGAVSSYAGFLKLLGLETTDTIPMGGYIKIKIAQGDGLRVIGFPHFSRYEITDKHLDQCGL